MGGDSMGGVALTFIPKFYRKELSFLPLFYLPEELE
jgi:hypothetical protein